MTYMSASTTRKGFSPREYKTRSISKPSSERTGHPQSAHRSGENNPTAGFEQSNARDPIYSDGAVEASAVTASFNIPLESESLRPFSQAPMSKSSGVNPTPMDEHLYLALQRRQTSSTPSSTPSSTVSTQSQTLSSTLRSPSLGDLTTTTSSTPSNSPLPTRLPRRNTVAMIAGTLVAAIAIAASLIVIFIVGCRRQKRRRRYSTGSSTSSSGEVPPNPSRTAEASISTHLPSSTVNTERGVLDSVTDVGSRGAVEGGTIDARRLEAVNLSDEPPAYERNPSRTSGTRRSSTVGVVT